MAACTRSGFLHVEKKMCALRAISSDGVGAAPEADAFLPPALPPLDDCSMSAASLASSAAMG
jgi:hypothetical protein